MSGHRRGGRRADRRADRRATHGHAHSHGHGHGHSGTTGAVDVGLRARVVLLGLVGLATLAAVVGLVVLWPDRAEVDRIDGLAGPGAPG